MCSAAAWRGRYALLPMEVIAVTTVSADAPTNLAKFQTLLRELFQFDCADLDFGIYRIMNHKRDAVERFITEQLPASISSELDGGPLAQQAQADDALGKARQAVVESLGDTAINADGELADAFRNVPVGQTYLDAQAQAANGNRGRDAVEAAIYNHLHAFFSRYYEEGDFISKRRYSGNQRYAIPYNGEEVYLHWANSDQYYVKTDEHFRNYDWKVPNGVAVHFRLKNADTEQNNVKGKRRFFLPLVSETAWDADSEVITIPFEYRPLSSGETVAYGSRNQQDKIISETVAKISEQLPGNTAAITALTGEHRRNGNGPVSRLEHHLRRYAARNNADFFVHKDLAGFLNRELDFYLKNEVLNLDNLTAAGQSMAEGWFQQMRLTKAVGSKIIDFLAQIEDFQKLLWEKRKFVTEIHYCITLGNIAPQFYPEISANDAQWEEWRELLAVDGNDRSAAFLTAHPTLSLDTQHFEAEFVDRLLASFGDLDAVTDGLLVHGENWQAISTIGERYRGVVQSVYIDPPYNTDASAILYKNGYKDSSWLCLMESLLSKTRALMSKRGILCCAIDDEEAPVVRLILRNLFPKELGIVVVRSNPAGRKSKGQFSPNHEYSLFVGEEDAVPGSLNKTKKELDRYPLVDDWGRFAWNNLVRHGSNDLRQDRPKLFYPIFIDSYENIRVPNMQWNDGRQEYDILEEATETETVVYPVRVQDGVVVEKNWHRGWQSVRRSPTEYRIRRAGANEDDISIDFKIRIDMNSMPKTWWDDSRYASANLGARALKDMFGQSNFDFAKAVGLVEDCVRASHSEADSLVLDYFAGSGTTGHAVINLNREDGGERKFILVEMGEHFDTVLLPRIKKATFSPEWKDGKPQRQATAEEAERSPRIVKYLRLESYEDALDSIEFDQSGGQLELPDAAEEYLLKYMLAWETKDSATLLNPALLTRPFSYKLRVRANGERQERKIDLPETFNYLLGLNVRKREVFDGEGRRYLVFRGETRDAPGRPVAVIWRETEGWAEADFARDRDFVEQHNLAGDADTVYVNGDSAIPGAKPIEPMFKARMFVGVNA